jgi:hypothetical protein
MQATFDGLAQLESALLRFQDEAGEAARNRWGSWVEWLPTFGGFNRACYNAAEGAGMDVKEVRQIVLDRLQVLFRREWERRERRVRAGTEAPPRPEGEGASPPQRGARPWCPMTHSPKPPAYEKFGCQLR